MTMTPVDFTRHPLSPPLADDFQGVAIKLEVTRLEGRLQILLHGAYRVSVGTARTTAALPLQRALVVTAVNGYTFGSMHLLGATLAFEDDETAVAGDVRGYFNADLLVRAPDFPWNGSHVSVSMGPVVSNVERLEFRL